MYSVGRIEDGIKRGRIIDTRANMREEKRIIPDEHVQVMSREERGSKRRSHTTREEPVKNHPRSPWYAQVSLASLHSPQKFAREYDQGSDSGYYQSKKRKGTKVYHALPMSYGELLRILVQNYGISVIPARPKIPPYSEGYDINARCEYHGGVRGHSTKDCTTFKDKVQSLINVDPIKFKDQLGAVFFLSFDHECFHSRMHFLKNVNFTLMSAFA